MTCSSAAWCGHLHVLQWLRGGQNPPCPWDTKACSNAAEYGYLDVLRWLRSQDPPCPWNVSDCLRLAEKGSHWDIVTWIRNANGDV
jgi:hypothetical protein